MPIPIVITRSGNLRSATKLGYPVIVDSDLPGCSCNYKAIRWGSSSACGRTSEYPDVINPAASIAKAVDKLQALRDMATVVGTPAIYDRVVPVGVRAVVRPIEHSEGSDFQVVTGPHNLAEGTHATKLVEATAEFRCWFFNHPKYSDTIVAKRIPLATAGNRPSDICRSKWGYSWMDEEDNEKLRKQALKAATKLGLHMGAADVIWVRSEAKYYFLEINTAPSLDTPQVLGFFKNGLKHLTSGTVTDVPRPHAYGEGSNRDDE